MRLRIILTCELGIAAILGTARGQTSSSPATTGNTATAGSAPLAGAVVQGPVPITLNPSPPTVIQYDPSVGLYWGPYGPVPYCPPLIVIGPGAAWPYYPYPPVPTVRGYYLEELYPPAPQRVPLATRIPQPVLRPKRINPGRANELMTIGDRHFRAKDLRRANERYEDALRIHPGSAAVRIRLAQIAFVREQYTEAANRLREALAAEPDWLPRTPDIQELYGEPTDFTAPIAKLERHLQTYPNDRDAWLVLGAQWFLAGRTKQAADVFLRLTDRQSDPTLEAFLVASKANQ